MVPIITIDQLNADVSLNSEMGICLIHQHLPMIIKGIKSIIVETEKQGTQTETDFRGIITKILCVNQKVMDAFCMPMDAFCTIR